MINSFHFYPKGTLVCIKLNYNKSLVLLRIFFLLNKFGQEIPGVLVATVFSSVCSNDHARSELSLSGHVEQGLLHPYY